MDIDAAASKCLRITPKEFLLLKRKAFLRGITEAAVAYETLQEAVKALRAFELKHGLDRWY